MNPITQSSSKEDLLERMMLIRAYEEQLAALQSEGKAAGTCTAVGQEAAAVGVIAALNADDRILTNHRSAGHLLARGAEPARMMAEVLGKSGGYCKGKSGSLHISVKELGVLLTSTIVGGELSLATGVALSLQMQKQAGIVACFFGDGAACEGVFHESLNLAAVWRLPILYVCENNQWQAFVHRNETMLGEHVSVHAAGYGMQSTVVDGNDVNAVRDAALTAAAQVRETGKPFLLEAITYRMRGHFEPDDQAYVDREELARWRARDPIAKLQAELEQANILDASGLQAMQARVRQQVAGAVEFALASPFPAASELTTDVYA